MSSDRSEFSELSSDRKPPYCQKGLIRSFCFFKGSNASLPILQSKHVFLLLQVFIAVQLDLYIIVVRRVDVHNS